jgi:hypothetical protein
LIRMLSRENPLWGAPHIHGELLNAQARHRHRRDERQQIHGRAPQAALADLEHVPRQSREDDGVSRFLHVATTRFQVLYPFLVLLHERRRILHFAVTSRRTAEWTAQKFEKPFRGTPRHGTCCAIMIGSDPPRVSGSLERVQRAKSAPAAPGIRGIDQISRG